MPSRDIDLVEDFSDGRVSCLTIFLGQFVPWGIEEIHCLYEHLEALIERNSQNLCCDVWGNWVDNYATPAPQDLSPPGQPLPGAKAKILSQGLDFLCTSATGIAKYAGELGKGLVFSMR